MSTLRVDALPYVSPKPIATPISNLYLMKRKKQGTLDSENFFKLTVRFLNEHAQYKRGVAGRKQWRIEILLRTLYLMLGSGNFFTLLLINIRTLYTQTIR